MKIYFWILISFFQIYSNGVSAAEEIKGFWKTVNEHTKKVDSIIAVYPYQGKYYGRIVVTYNDDGSLNDTVDKPKTRAPGVEGDPFYAGLDMIWDLKEQGNKFSNGSIMDPEKGNIYGAEVWKEGDNLIVRGELLIFGRNQTWLPVLKNEFPENFKVPNLASFVPVIPKPASQSEKEASLNQNKE